MTQPTSYGGRPLTPAPGAPTPELLVARFRAHARRLSWSALVLIAVAAACGYFYGNLPAPLEDWMLLAGAAVVVLLLVVLPYLAWAGHIYTITTRRVMERRGVLSVKRRELAHVRGYTLKVRRGLLQRMWGAGTITLTNGIDEPLKLANIPSAELVHEALVDQVEVNQILAHRDAQPLPPGAQPSVPPKPPLPQA
ncbi:PH domain-containing protein [Microbacterium sp. LWH7-1.2]|uniref:PH domain-containing protein n=1 Tax=Microbacterium sp. LWH7-1.2 TaxID=3135257 RepID=UPI003138D272